MEIFSLLSGIAILIFSWAHFTFFRDVAMDRIYPNCFRGDRYGACEYYKEFYDPSHHKTAYPFKNDVKNRKISTIHYLERKLIKSIFVSSRLILLFSSAAFVFLI